MSKSKSAGKKKQMVINYVPGEECRVAIVDGGKLEEFHAERLDGPSNHVGNIYVGKVMNVEPAIQAAFVDFGLEQNGFLHISDVHPQYFPGADTDETERVGKKTPRRERPPIQDCFRRGDEVAVQVLKEGVGTKGPTVTSYLSIPGRFLVMMPQMDKVGVSRKVEDEDTRRKMREILDQLDLPDGFGFILRTAGMERTKTELKRDLAYLMRLWKDMEHRWQTGDKPRLLYSESDLLVRALRDLLTSDIDEIVVDNQSALNRCARFLKIVAPRNATRLIHYTGKSPIYHVTGVEPQIQIIHAREVPLSSGGRLVIDEAEALVAIDVNSGKSRDARDSETNAFQTNLEAVDEICRQLRLRDLGGVIVNDLIDMRSAKHRRDIEARFRENLKKDRARWTIAPISEFGILEMTRQRMRASHESQHFTDCPTCRGRGLVQRPDSVAGDAMRDLASLLDNQQVQRVEIVVHPRIAGELLSTKRKALSRIERTSGKHVDVRISEAIQVDRITFYAYDDRGADLDIEKLADRRIPEEEFVTYEITSDAQDAGDDWATPHAEEIAIEPEEQYEEPADLEPHPIELEPLSLAELAEQDRMRQRAPQDDRGGYPQQGGYNDQGQRFDQGDGQGEGGPRRRRRRRGRRGGRDRADFQQQPHAPASGYDQYDASGAPIVDSTVGDSFNVEDNEALIADPEHAVGEGTHHHETGHHQPHYQQNGAPYPADGQFPQGEPGEGGRRRRRRRRRGRRGQGGQGQMNAQGQMMPQGQFDQGVYPQGEYAESGEPGEFEQGEFPQGGFDQPQQEGAYADQYSDSGDPEAGASYQDDTAGAYSEPGDGSGGFAPQQQPFDGPVGPDGERRGRRRRRRGRRGGGGNGGGGDRGPGFPQQQGQPRRDQPQAPSLAAMFRSSSDEVTGPADQGPAAEEPVNDDFVPDAGEPQGEFPSDQPEGPRGGRRRRGRRGGRGGGDRGPAGGPTDQPVDRTEPRAESRAERPAPPPPPAAAPAPQPALQPKIRTLYSTSRRKIAPGQIKGLKRED